MAGPFTGSLRGKALNFNPARALPNSKNEFCYSRVANYIADVVVSPGVSDLTGSFRLYRKDVLARLINEVKSKGYFFQPEMIIRARSMGYRIGQVPITFVDRVFGESKFGAGMIAEWLRVLLELWWELD